MIKALHICQRDDAATGGAARVAVELVKRLPECGVDTKCVFVYGPPGPFSREISGRALHLGLASGREAFWRSDLLRECLRHEKPDIIHHHDGLSWTHWVTRGWHGSRCVGHAHLAPPPDGSPWRSRLANLLHRRTYEHLFCVSAATGQAWNQAGFPKTRTTEIVNGVDTLRFCPALTPEKVAIRTQWGIPAEDRVVGFVGRLDSRTKGCDDFIRTIAALPDGYWGVIAGTGPDEYTLKALATELGVDHRIRFLGLVESVEQVYRGMTVSVLTSYHETFGLVILEAGASGVPVVAMPSVGGAGELIGRLGMGLLKARDIAALGHAIVAVAEAAEKTPASLQSCRVQIEREFSWDASVAAVAREYFKLLAAKVATA